METEVELQEIKKVCRENGWDGNGKVSQFILAEIKGYEQYRENQRRAGSSTSEAKAFSSRLNGLKGGRPRK